MQPGERGMINQVVFRRQGLVWVLSSLEKDWVQEKGSVNHPAE